MTSEAVLPFQVTREIESVTVHLARTQLTPVETFALVQALLDAVKLCKLRWVPGMLSNFKEPWKETPARCTLAPGHDGKHRMMNQEGTIWWEEP